MTKHDILEYFKDINYVYNNSNQLDTLSSMIDELLKEQEPVKPKEERLDDVDSIFRCGNCGVCFYLPRQKYCAICGRKVKWND